MFGELEQFSCKCGKEHSFASKVIIGDGVINELPSALLALKAKKVFVYADKKTYSAAGAAVCERLVAGGLDVRKYVFAKENLEPDEANVGLAMMNFDPTCDAVIGVGSGVINDICKIVANVSNKYYVIVGTAPSMDGYASATSSMTMDGLKISLGSKCADMIIGDLDILCNAPVKLMISGLGDMLAKYVSICEWRIAHVITGEYYCEEIAKLVRASLKKCVDQAESLLKRDKAAVKAVFEGLVVCGAAMKFAGVSRPASGVEHYISHIWDMRAAEFDTPAELHGIQCAIGTLIAVGLYEKLVKIVPDQKKALDYAERFSFEVWSETLREFLGKGAESMILLNEKEQKYDKDRHKVRLQRIMDNWETILQIISEELPSSEKIEMLLVSIGLPKTMEEIGLESSLLPLTFKATKDIRDKYVLSRLCWDLGVLDEMV